jgi:hypothetical protein
MVHFAARACEARGGHRHGEDEHSDDGTNMMVEIKERGGAPDFSNAKVISISDKRG